MTEILDGEEGPPSFSWRIFVPSPSWSFSVLLMLTVLFFAYSSTRSLSPILYSMSFLLASLPVRTRESPPRRALQRHREYSLPRKRRWPRCCRLVVCICRPSYSHLARASVAHCSAHSHPLLHQGAPAFSHSPRGPRRCQGQPVPHFTPTFARTKALYTSLPTVIQTRKPTRSPLL